MKSYEEVMEILEAFDLTRSFRSAGELAGCSHHTVEDWVAKRDRGELPVPGEVVERPKLIDPGIALTLVVAALLSLASFGRSFGHELVRAAATQLAEDLSAFVV